MGEDALADQVAGKQMTYPATAVYVRFTPEQFLHLFPPLHKLAVKLDETYRPMVVEGTRVDEISFPGDFSRVLRDDNHIRTDRVILINFETRPDNDNPGRGMLLAGVISLIVGAGWTGLRRMLAAKPPARTGA